ncbi:amino acid ABC transporter substrate-binding protein, PAAT family [Dendrosporobacter quercicolus]|uniref:Amino acid ABC transporter substrate-binding protein, PAAT family n=1 Tax=Dendrosporobacter quercicolus TaxID=146817 RepID=A0A1G9U2D9_9FIRM|nr:cysteine ABC transporter substrate-binding protein [Dendrosporobacter quercicolus]SDM54051.1 amino acid ABC transporter substrate-binding protein, PAAT family [Dendrosporobacter quercicolus]
MSMKKMMALVFSTLFLVGVLAGCGSSAKTDDKAAQAGKSSIEEIKQRGTIRIGVFSDKPPFGFVDANGKNQGFDVYIAKRFAKDLLGDESKVEFVLVEAASRVEFLQANKVDIILANFTVTDERKQIVDFANPYMKVALGVVSPSGQPVKSVEELKGKKLIVNKGTTAETYFTKNHPDIELLKYDQNTEAFEALKDKRGAALAHDNTLLFAWAKENAGYSVGIPSLGSLDTIAPAVKKGNTELLNWINTELETLGKENFIHKAYQETLKPAYSDDINPEDIVVEGGKL